MIKCPFCHFENEDGALFCERCTSDLTGAKFIGVKLIDVKLDMLDLRKTVFEDCIFSGVDFKYCDLRGKALDGQAFIGVKFDNGLSGFRITQRTLGGEWEIPFLAIGWSVALSVITTLVELGDSTANLCPMHDAQKALTDYVENE